MKSATGSIRKDWIEVEGVRIHYLVGGKRCNPTIFLHGGGSDSAELSWGSSLQDFSRTFNCIAPDLPGYGKSEKPDINYNSEYYTHFIQHLCDNLNLSRFSLVGLSLGGHASLRFSLKYPDRVEKLVLVSPAGLGVPLRWCILARLMIHMPWLHKRIRERASLNTIRLALRNIVYDATALPNSVIRRVSATLSKPQSGRAWRTYLDRELGWFKSRDNLFGRLGDLRTKTLIIHGAEDRMVPLKQALAAQRAIPEAQLHVIHHCGHWPQIEHPDEFRQVVSNFLGDRTLSNSTTLLPKAH